MTPSDKTRAWELFLPCAQGVEEMLAAEVERIAVAHQSQLLLRPMRAGVAVKSAPGEGWRDVMLLNLWSRLASRVLVQLAHAPAANEDAIYAAARHLPWEAWFRADQTFKIESSATASPLQSLNFATLRVKDAIVDRFREQSGDRPSIETRWPQVRVFAHFTRDTVALSIDTSGEPLFKRGWREDKGDAPLKETLAAAMLEASGWAEMARDFHAGKRPDLPPLYDPCCGSGTIAVEAADLALGLAPGRLRRFGFEALKACPLNDWHAIKNRAKEVRGTPATPQKDQKNASEGRFWVYASDVSFRMVDFAKRNAERAGVAHAIEVRGGDALQRQPPSEQAGVVLMNPPYGERIEAAGVAGRDAMRRDAEETEAEPEFFQRLAAHWKTHFGGWTAWVLTPNLKLPGTMRLKESRRVPLWNGPIECRMFRFDVTARRAPASDSPEVPQRA
jgi:putative N6-adenine-specific DNA methylase